MNNIEKKLDALIDALGFDVREVVSTFESPSSIKKALFTDRFNPQTPVTTIDHKLTKRNTVKKKPKVWIICPLCEGTGSFERHKAAGKCPECAGAGKVSSNE